MQHVPLKIPIEADRDPVTGLIPCLACTQCCHYVAMEIDTPDTREEFDQIRWYLYHPGIEVYIDHDDKWNLLFQSRCEQLQPDGKCGVYAHRPQICRDFSEKNCEPNTNEPAEKVLMKSAADLEQWMRLSRAHDRLIMQEAAAERRRQKRAAAKAAKVAQPNGRNGKNGRGGKHETPKASSARRALTRDRRSR